MSHDPRAYTQITYTDLALAVGLILICVIASRAQRLDLERDLLIGTVRSLIQLFAIGYVLELIFHINSILQPSVATSAPVVGVALTGVRPVPGCGTGASQEIDIEAAARFCLEVAKAFGAGKCRFYDTDEFSRLVRLYGSMKHLQTPGKA